MSVRSTILIALLARPAPGQAETAGAATGAVGIVAPFTTLSPPRSGAAGGSSVGSGVFGEPLSPRAAGDGDRRFPEIQAGQRLGGLDVAPPSPQIFGLSVVKKAQAGRRLGGGTDSPSPEAVTRDPRDMFEQLSRALADPRIRPN